ncbi:hypothetical protein O181_083640 [Austropuccinia psidii MF-1]|uniref:RlpA-like protein double-psi beta-barrel domain-containing protein n=1 Tax=Austropuccinia psidii MF-1 TaxID=1389203 RepID=A0A9Q3ILT3_9BASI|nr:hypothetical protein [Austropuccinia psidii MF-1]
MLNLNRITITITILLISNFNLIKSTNHQQIPISLEDHFNQIDNSDDLDNWNDISVGLIVKSDSNQTLSKRSSLATTTTSTVFLNRDPKTQKFILPRSLESTKDLLKRNLHHKLKHYIKRSIMSIKITWYSGQDLLNPSCFPDIDSWAPTDNSLVGATTIEWDGKPKCGAFVQIRSKNKKKKVTIRIADSCGGCAQGTAHIDLTRRAFSKLYDVDIGEVTGLQAKIVNLPAGHKWSEKDIALYGPQKCIGS